MSVKDVNPNQRQSEPPHLITSDSISLFITLILNVNIEVDLALWVVDVF